MQLQLRLKCHYLEIEKEGEGWTKFCKTHEPREKLLGGLVVATNPEIGTKSFSADSLNFYWKINN